MTITLPELSPQNALIGGVALWYAVAAVCVRCDVLKSWHIPADTREPSSFDACMAKCFTWLLSPLMLGLMLGAAAITVPLLAFASVGWLLGGSRTPALPAQPASESPPVAPDADAQATVSEVVRAHQDMQYQLAILRAAVKGATEELKRKEGQQ